MAELLLTLGVGTGAAGTIATAATIASPVLGVMGALAGVQERQEQRAEFEREAKESRIMASAEAAKMRREARQRQSRSRAMMAEGGVLSGTSLGGLDQNAIAMELDALNVEFQGEQQAKSAEFQASQSKANYLDVFSSAVEGFTQMDPLNLTPGGKFVRSNTNGEWVKS